MNTVLQARPRNFVSTPTLERTAFRTLRYLKSGYSVHLKGAAGTGKTTLALHLADLLGRPIMLLFGDDEFKTSDLIGSQTGYTRKKVVDNYIHSVMKVEDELRQNWIDSRLTLACREGFTLVYDEFNRSRPEVNNVLLSALEEKLLVLPPNQNRSEYIRVSPHFRAIFTSNPEEYCGVHGTQDALQDRLITINMPEPDELAQQQILTQKVGLDPIAALQIVRIVRAFQTDAAPDMVSSLRPSLMIATICNDHGIIPLAENADFRDVCSDILLTRSKHPLPEATRRLWDLFNQFVASQVDVAEQLQGGQAPRAVRLHGEDDDSDGVPPPVNNAVIEAPPVIEESPLEEPVLATPMLEDPALEALTQEEPILEEPALEGFPPAEDTVLGTAESALEEAVIEPEEAAVFEAEAPAASVQEAPALEESAPEAEASAPEESALEDTVLEDAVLEDTVPEALISEAPVLETPIPEEPAPGEPAPEEPEAEAPALTETVETEAPAEETLLDEPMIENILLEESEPVVTESNLDTESDLEAESVFGASIPQEEGFWDESSQEAVFLEEEPFLEDSMQEEPTFEEQAFLEDDTQEDLTFSEAAFLEEPTPADETLNPQSVDDEGMGEAIATDGFSESFADRETVVDRLPLATPEAVAASPVSTVAVAEPAAFASVMVDSPANGHSPANPPSTQTNSPIEERIFDFLDTVGSASFSRIETDLGLTRFQVVNALKSMLDQGLIEKGADGQRPSVYQIRAEYQELL